MPSSTDTQVFPLLELPQELRDKIYRFLLVSEFALRVPLYMTAGPQTSIDTGILRTSTQIYAKAHAILLKENTYLCQINGPGNVVRESILRLARHLKVEYNAGHDMAQDGLVEFLSTCPLLRSLHLDLHCCPMDPLQRCSETLDQHFNSIQVLALDILESFPKISLVACMSSM